MRSVFWMVISINSYMRNIIIPAPSTGWCGKTRRGCLMAPQLPSIWHPERRARWSRLRPRELTKLDVIEISGNSMGNSYYETKKQQQQQQHHLQENSERLVVVWVVVGRIMYSIWMYIYILIPNKTRSMMLIQTRSLPLDSTQEETCLWKLLGCDLGLSILPVGETTVYGHCFGPVEHMVVK